MRQRNGWGSSCVTIGSQIGSSKKRGLGQRPKPRAYFLCGKEEHFKREWPKARTPAPRPCPMCWGHHWKRDFPQRCRSLGWTPQGQDQNWLDPGLFILAPVLITTQEPWVTLSVGGQPIDFFLDMGATFLILSYNPRVSSNKSATIHSISGKLVTKLFTQCLSCYWESIFFSHALLIILESPTPLLERDILPKVKDSIHDNGV